MPVSTANSQIVFDALKHNGVRIMSALPETWLVHLIRMAEDDPDTVLVRLAKEEEGVGVSMGAHLAGLGWIGKSCMLITPQFGPRVRWATVLTNAPLAATGEAQPEKCAGCTRCIDICPVQAYTGRPFQLGEPRHLRFDVYKCKAYLSKREDTYGASVCSKCLIVCPFGHMSHEASSGIAIKCDLCGGDNPACAAFCPTRTLEYA